MQSRKGIKNRNAATPDEVHSFERKEAQRDIDLKMVEALARIERVRSKALAALGTMISASAG